MMIHADFHEMEHETGIGIVIVIVSEITVVIEIVTTNVETNDDKVDIVKDRQVQGLVDLTLQVQETTKTK